MILDEFFSLPVALQIKTLLLAAPTLADKLVLMEAPRVPRPPAFDQRIRCKNGFMWASETDLNGLHYWRDAALKPGNPEYAEKNAKQAKSLEYWIAWRECSPTEQWHGERFHEQIKAEAPSSKPRIYEWEERGAAPAAIGGASDGFGGGSDDFASGDDLPF